MDFFQLMKDSAAEAGIELTEEQYNKFMKYKELVLEWNQKINLTAITENSEFITKHFIDCIKIFKSDEDPLDHLQVIQLFKFDTKSQKFPSALELHEFLQVNEHIDRIMNAYDMMTKVMNVEGGKQQVKIISWYDNEMSYTAQLVRLVGFVATQI